DCMYRLLLYDLMLSGSLYSKEGLAFVERAERLVEEKNSYSMLFLLNESLIGGQKNAVFPWFLPYIYKQEHLVFMQKKECISNAQVIELTTYLIRKNQADTKLTADEQYYRAALLYKARAFLNNMKGGRNDDKEIKMNLTLAFDNFMRVSQAY